MDKVNTILSARDRGYIDEIIKALECLEKEKMIWYGEEIDFLKRIRGAKSMNFDPVLSGPNADVVYKQRYNDSIV